MQAARSEGQQIVVSAFFYGYGFQDISLCDNTDPFKAYWHVTQELSEESSCMTDASDDCDNMVDTGTFSIGSNSGIGSDNPLKMIINEPTTWNVNQK